AISHPGAPMPPTPSAMPTTPQPPEAPETALRRRAFLTYCGSLGLGGTLFPGTPWAAPVGGQGAVTREVTAHAARPAGSEPSPWDLEEMVEGVAANIELYRELRTVPIDQSVAPPLHFSPVVTGQTFSDERRPFRPSPEPDVSRPADLEDVAFWPVTHL